MEDGDTESENASRLIQDFVFLFRKIGSINGYFCRYIIKKLDSQFYSCFNGICLSPCPNIQLFQIAFSG